MGRSKHDDIASKLAKKEGTEYNRGPGADVQSSRRAIEVETPASLGDAGRQLQGYKKPVYVVPTEKTGVGDAINRYRNTTIGVMSPTGKVVKRSTRARNHG